MNNSPNLDPLEVIKVIMAVMMSQQLAAVVGPYSLIFIMAIIGSATRLSERPRTSRTNSFVFLTCTSAASVVLTVPASNLVAAYVDALKAEWLFLVMAVFLAYIADRVPGWVVTFISAMLGRWLKRTETKP